MQRLLNDALLGKTIREVEEGLGRGMYEAFRSPLVRMARDEVLSCLQEGDLSRALSTGSAPGSFPPNPSSASPNPWFPFSKRSRTTPSSCTSTMRGSVRDAPCAISSENEDEALSGVSVVASSYGRGPSMGVVAVIGPTRMDYCVIQAVRIARNALGDI